MYQLGSRSSELNPTSKSSHAPCYPAAMQDKKCPRLVEMFVLLYEYQVRSSPMQALARSFIVQHQNTYPCCRICIQKDQLHFTGSPVPIAILDVVLMMEMTITVQPNATTAMARYVCELFFDSLM